ncbi:MAG: hypothetical protein ABI867_40140 [Kofleriaceae bacterium]
MVRLGELLVSTGLLTPEQVELALRAQVMWGGRLGTNFVELGLIDLDALSQALARQQKIPAALARHFDKADRELQQKLSADVAERFSVVPLMRIGPQKMVVMASIGAIDKRGLAIIAGELEVTPDQLITTIAAELRVRYHLERVYKIPRGTRFLRSRGKTIPPFPQFEISPFETQDSEVDTPLPTAELVITQDDRAATEPSGPAELADLSALAILDEADRAEPVDLTDDLEVPTAEPSGRDRRRYVRTLADEASTTDSERALGRIAIRRVAITAAPAGGTLGEATRAIRRSTDRDKVAELVMSALERFLPTCEAATLLVVRGEIAIGWKGHSRGGHQLPDIAVPLDQVGLVPRSIQRMATQRASAAELHPIDQLLVVSLGCRSGDLCVIPVTIAEQVMCLIALVVTPDTAISSGESIAAACGAAFARLMRDASR